MENKNYMPQNCRICPAAKVEKGKLKCKCSGKTAITPHEEVIIWKNCPINWDKKENK